MFTFSTFENTSVAGDDLSYLYFCRWLNSFDSHGQILGIDFMETITFWCRTTFFLRYAGKLASAWITVVISAERFITVAYPFKVSQISTPGIAKCVILVIYILSVIFGAYPFWTLGLLPEGNTTYCGYMNNNLYDTWSMAILRIGSLFLPSLIIVIFTTLILTCLHLAKIHRSAHFEGQVHVSKKSAKLSNMDFQLTAMLISVAIAFLVLRLPYTMSFYLTMYKNDIWVPLDPRVDLQIYFANKICDVIAISNYTVNFFLYCLCGSSFRAHFVALLTCQKNKMATIASSTKKAAKYYVFIFSPRKTASISVWTIRLSGSLRLDHSQSRLLCVALLVRAGV